MTLHIRHIDLPDLDLDRIGFGNGCADDLGPGADLIAVSIAAPPPGKHDLSECERYEQTWRQRFPDVVAALAAAQKCACVLWVQGPFDSDNMIPFLKYVDDWNDHGVRFHFAGCSSLQGRCGYVTTWIAFEYDPAMVCAMMEDRSLDYETMRLSLIVAPQELLPELLTSSFRSLGPKWISQHGAIACIMRRHFEGCYLLGPPEKMRQVLERMGELHG